MSILDVASQFTSAASGGLGGVEGMAHDHPYLAALAGAFLLHETEGHGLIRGVADFWTLKNLFQGKAGMLGKAYLAYDAAEGASGLAGKAGGGGLSKFFAGVAGFLGTYWGEGKMEDNINTPTKKAPAMAPG